MPRPLHIGWLEPVAVAAVAVLLVVLAALQYNWLDQLARQEAQSRQAAARAAALGLRDLLDDRLEAAAEAMAMAARAAPELAGAGPAPALRAPMAELTDELFWLSGSAGPGTAVRRLDLTGGGFRPAGWSDLGQAAPGVARVLATEGLDALLGGDVGAPVLVALARAHTARGPTPGILVLPVRRADLETLLAGRLANVGSSLQPGLRFSITRAGSGAKGWTLGRRRGLASQPVAGYWQLTMETPPQSALIATARTRNLVLASGIILLLGASAALLWGAARVSRRLAEHRLEMVAGVSHELRTPLAVIHSAAANLADGVVSGPTHTAEYGELIRSEADRLRRFVDSALRVAGVAQQPSPAGQERAAVDEALARATEGLPADRTPTWDPPLATLAGTDAAMSPGDLHLVLSNVIGNAVVHAAGAGRSRVMTRTAGNRLILETRNPADVDPSELARLCEPFFRGRDARARRPAGSGMGLAIVRSIVERYGGRVALRREDGALVVTVELPLAAGARS